MEVVTPGGVIAVGKVTQLLYVVLAPLLAAVAGRLALVIKLLRFVRVVALSTGTRVRATTGLDGQRAVSHCEEVDIDAVAVELYGLTPDEFTAARNQLAKTIGGPTAAAIKALRRPTLAAWLANLLVQTARAEAKTLGRSVTPTVADRLTETLDAALIDPGAEQLLRSGQLTSALRHVGFGVVDETGSPAQLAPIKPRTVRNTPANKPIKKPAKNIARNGCDSSPIWSSESV